MKWHYEAHVGHMNFIELQLGIGMDTDKVDRHFPAFGKRDQCTNNSIIQNKEEFVNLKLTSGETFTDAREDCDSHVQVDER
jgi:hypothetical protein